MRLTVPRIPFQEALAEPLLLKACWDELSLLQQVALLAINGCPLASQEEHRAWAILQGAYTYDALGYVTDVGDVPYVPKRYHEVWACLARRSGKSDRIAALQVVYEACCGGHEAYMRQGRPAVCFQIAQDLRLARYTLHSLRATLESSPLLKQMVINVTADRIDLKNQITIAVVPPTVKSVRGYDNPISVFDEVGVWYSEEDSANPDREIYRAVKPGQMQFPDALLIGISSPWIKSGLLWKNAQAGTEGCKLPPGADKAEFHGVLVMTVTTAASGNPLVAREWLKDEQTRDPLAFRRECLAEFPDSISGFLDAGLLEAAVLPAVTEHQPLEHRYYVAAIDPAFRRDAFAFAIAHAEPTGVVLDYVQRWLPEAGQPLNPKEVFAQIAPILQRYRCLTCASDQYQIDALQQLALEHNFALERVNFTSGSKAEIYANFQQLLNQGKLKLLDHPEMLTELKRIERTTRPGGSVAIAAPSGEYDDMATVVALAAYKAVWLLPLADEDKPKEPTREEKIIAKHEHNRQVVMLGAYD